MILTIGVREAIHTPTIIQYYEKFKIPKCTTKLFMKKFHQTSTKYLTYVKPKVSSLQHDTYVKGWMVCWFLPTLQSIHTLRSNKTKYPLYNMYSFINDLVCKQLTHATTRDAVHVYVVISIIGSSDRHVPLYFIFFYFRLFNNVLHDYLVGVIKPCWADLVLLNLLIFFLLFNHITSFTCKIIYLINKF